MTDPKQKSDPRDQEQPVETHPRAQDPTAVDRTRDSDATTINNGGLAGGRPEGGARITPERAHNERTPDDPVMPDDESTLNTRI